MKLSILKVLFTKDDKFLTNLIFIDSNYDNEICDIAIVLGGISMIPYRVNKAIEFYKKGLVKKILVSGGVIVKGTRNTEAIEMKNYLLDNGVNEEDIYIEDKSLNTIQNIKYSLCILNNLNIKDDSKILLLSSDFHIKRSKGIFRKQTNNYKLYYYGIVDDYSSKNVWNNKYIGRKIIKREAFWFVLLSKLKFIKE